MKSHLYLIFSLFILGVESTWTTGEGDEPNDASSVVVEYALSDGKSGGSGERFEQFASINVRSFASNIAYKNSVKAFTLAEIEQLKKLHSSNKSLFRVRVVPNRSSRPEEALEASIRVCQLIASPELDLLLTLSVDAYGAIIGAHLSTPLVDGCSTPKIQDLDDIEKVNLRVTVQSPATGLGPDTQTYIKKMEREREEKARAEQGDNRSFLMKYGMYIIPALFIIMMLSNAGDPNASGGGR